MTSSWENAIGEQENQMLKEKYQKEVDEILSRYPVKRSALIPLLYLAQQDQGFVSEAAMKEIAGCCV
jgi:NADH:ubiquinone oxidoreductase subunit E